MITFDELFEYRHAKPFRPFFIELNNGEIVEVLETLSMGGIDDRVGVGHPEFGITLFKIQDVKQVRLMSDSEIQQRSHLFRKKRA